MEEYLSQDVINIILHSDIYNLVDWELYDSIRNVEGGGIMLFACIKTITPIFRLGYVNDQGSDIINGDIESFSNKLKEDFGRDIYGKERLVTGWIEIQSQGTVCIYITRDEETGVYTTHFITKEGNEQYYTNVLMVKFPSDWYSEIKVLVAQLLGEDIDELGIKAEVYTFIDQAKLVLEHDVLWGLV